MSQATELLVHICKIRHLVYSKFITIYQFIIYKYICIDHDIFKHKRYMAYLIV